ncbi:MAG TPA: cystathionine beta-synthase [Anaerolineales bacterium]|nr:cystathionine beta-synthase [Anaerolineales bacterium]
MSLFHLPVSETLQVYDNIVQTIGNTPLVRLGRLGADLSCALYAKVEFFNPGGSVKDRIGLNIIEEAERNGRLKPGGTVVEATSGNTGVGLAIICALKGYKSVFVMPDKMSQEKIQLLRAFGARVILTPTAVEPDDPRSYYKVSARLAHETPNAILANQYHNPENTRSHYQTTGPELWEQTEGKITDFVATMGTGGTITGTARYLKEKNSNIRIIGVDSTGSILKEAWENGGTVPPGAEAYPYKVEGFGEDFVPTTLDLSIVDDVIRVTDKECFLWARRLVKQEGIFTGGSCGAAVAAAVRYCRDLPPDRLVVVLLPDSGSRYLSKLYDDKWMRENGFLEYAWSEVMLRDLVAAKTGPDLITAQITDSISQVIQSMKKYDISQVPVINPDGTLAGLVNEVTLLQHMLGLDHTHSAEETLEAMIRPAKSVYPGYTLLEEILPAVTEGNVIIVTDNGKPAGILTKIDLLDYIAQSL